LNPRLKSIVLKILPRPFLKRLTGVWNSYNLRKSRQAREAFESEGESNAWLGWDDLERLFQQYPFPEKYRYDPETVSKRGRERAAEVMSVLGRRSVGMKSLELGALDAQASFFLQKRGFLATAIDITDSHFADIVRDAGVSLRVMDAEKLDFPDNSFDLVFSYNAFEHFDDPAAALSEALRVLRPGGFLYVNFGPLYGSPMGLHGHESIPIPYCQFLWTRDVLERFCREKDLGTIEFDTINMWPASRFRDLWKLHGDRLKTVRYFERLDCYGHELIEKYPACFRGKVSEFDDLIVSAIEALWRRL